MSTSKLNTSDTTFNQQEYKSNKIPNGHKIDLNLRVSKKISTQVCKSISNENRIDLTLSPTEENKQTLIEISNNDKEELQRDNKEPLALFVGLANSLQQNPNVNEITSLAETTQSLLDNLLKYPELYKAFKNYFNKAVGRRESKTDHFRNQNTLEQLQTEIFIYGTDFNEELLDKYLLELNNSASRLALKIMGIKSNLKIKEIIKTNPELSYKGLTNKKNPELFNAYKKICGIIQEDIFLNYNLDNSFSENNAVPKIPISKFPIIENAIAAKIQQSTEVQYVEDYDNFLDFAIKCDSQKIQKKITENLNKKHIESITGFPENSEITKKNNIIYFMINQYKKFYEYPEERVFLKENILSIIDSYLNPNGQMSTDTKNPIIQSLSKGVTNQLTYEKSKKEHIHKLFLAYPHCNKTDELINLTENELSSSMDYQLAINRFLESANKGEIPEEFSPIILNIIEIGITSPDKEIQSKIKDFINIFLKKDNNENSLINNFKLDKDDIRDLIIKASFNIKKGSSTELIDDISEEIFNNKKIADEFVRLANKSLSLKDEADQKEIIELQNNQRDLLLEYFKKNKEKISPKLILSILKNIKTITSFRRINAEEKPYRYNELMEITEDLPLNKSSAIFWHLDESLNERNLKFRMDFIIDLFLIIFKDITNKDSITRDHCNALRVISSMFYSGRAAYIFKESTTEQRDKITKYQRQIEELFSPIKLKLDNLNEKINRLNQKINSLELKNNKDKKNTSQLNKELESLESEKHEFSLNNNDIIDAINAFKTIQFQNPEIK